MYVFELPSACCSSTPTSSSQPHKFHHFPSSSTAKKPLLSSLSDIASQDSIWRSFLSPSLSVIPKGKHTTRPHHHLNQLHNSHPRLQPGPAPGRDHSSLEPFADSSKREKATSSPWSQTHALCIFLLESICGGFQLPRAEGFRANRRGFRLFSFPQRPTKLCLLSTLINTSNHTALHHITLNCVWFACMNFAFADCCLFQ